MNLKDPRDLNDIDRKLDKAFADAVQSSPDLVAANKIHRRRWFGVGALILAVFCILVAGMAWPGKQPVDQGMWVVFSVVMLLVGGGSFYKADKEEDRANAIREKLQTPPLNGSPGLRRLK